MGTSFLGELTILYQSSLALHLLKYVFVFFSQNKHLVTSFKCAVAFAFAFA